MASFTKNISKLPWNLSNPPMIFRTNLGHPGGCNSLVWSFNCLPIAVMQRLSGIHQLGGPLAGILYTARFGISRMTFSNGFGWVWTNLYWIVGVRWLLVLKIMTPGLFSGVIGSLGKVYSKIFKHHAAGDEKIRILGDADLFEKEVSDPPFNNRAMKKFKLWVINQRWVGSEFFVFCPVARKELGRSTMNSW